MAACDLPDSVGSFIDKEKENRKAMVESAKDRVKGSGDGLKSLVTGYLDEAEEVVKKDRFATDECKLGEVRELLRDVNRARELGADMGNLPGLLEGRVTALQAVLLAKGAQAIGLGGLGAVLGLEALAQRYVNKKINDVLSAQCEEDALGELEGEICADYQAPATSRFGNRPPDLI